MPFLSWQSDLEGPPTAVLAGFCVEVVPAGDTKMQRGSEGPPWVAEVGTVVT